VVNEAVRTCAWERMSGGCAGATSPSCSFSGAAEQLADDDLVGSTASMDNIDGLFPAFGVQFRDMFGPAFRPIFGAERHVRVPRPRALGGGDMGVGAAFSEMCNETSGDQTLAGFSSDTFCRMTGWCD